MQKLNNEKLIEILNKARSAAGEYVKKGLWVSHEIDLDAYSYLFIKIDGRNKGFWNSLLEISENIPWIEVNSKTKTIQIYPEIKLTYNKIDSGMNQRIAEVLSIEGIPCYEHTHYRN
ncbi:MAG: hypothetical protein JST15_07895 [Bacteroidetes bacterium]|nr:hypothetical protein [Bacteroidota bacterium]